MTYQQLYRATCRRLADVFPETASFEGAQFFAATTGLTAYQLPLRGQDEASQEVAAQLEALLLRRLAHEPLQYLLGEWEFYGLTLAVGPGVLIPRGDTEVVVETALGLLDGVTAPVIADLCSGTGAIALALWNHLPQAHITAVELSDQALIYLQKNVAALCGDSDHPVEILQGDVLKGVPLPLLDLLVSNPPYISGEEMEALSPEVLQEPRMALEAPEEGLLFYRQLPLLYREALKPGGWMVFEVGYQQADAVMEFLQQSGYVNIRCAQDLAGIRRCVYGQKPGD